MKIWETFGGHIEGGISEERKKNSWLMRDYSGCQSLGNHMPMIGNGGKLKEKKKKKKKNGRLQNS